MHAPDADRLAARFVAELEKLGHWIDEASFTYGGAEDLILDPDEEE